jgi:nucleotide-binding universal stress UspA family protein
MPTCSRLRLLRHHRPHTQLYMERMTTDKMLAQGRRGTGLRPPAGPAMSAKALSRRRLGSSRIGPRHPAPRRCLSTCAGGEDRASRRRILARKGRASRASRERRGSRPCTQSQVWVPPDEGVLMTAEASPSPGHQIVVGVDGSVPSMAALRWALRQAHLTGAVVEAVTAWEFPVVYGYPAPVLDGVNFEELATNVVKDAIAEATPHAEVGRVYYKVVEGNAASALLKESAGADLLVVGSRGHGGFAEALLGSTGQHCVHHATCPVVVIRDSVPDQTPDPDRS